MANREGTNATLEAPAAYLKLVRTFPLRPIRSDDSLDRAIAVINSLLDRDDLSPAEADYLDVLSDLVERYETEEHPMEDVSDADMLQHLIEAKGVTQAEVARLRRDRRFYHLRSVVRQTRPQSDTHRQARPLLRCRSGRLLFRC